MNANVSKLLNEQINKEFYSAYLYLDFANYYACLLYTSTIETNLACSSRCICSASSFALSVCSLALLF